MAFKLPSVKILENKYSRKFNFVFLFNFSDCEGAATWISIFLTRSAKEVNVRRTVSIVLVVGKGEVVLSGVITFSSGVSMCSNSNDMAWFNDDRMESNSLSETCVSLSSSKYYAY